MTGAAAHASSRRRAAPRRRGAFTLVEMLVVVGLIALLVGGLGLALAGRGSSGASLASAQGLVQGLVTSARAQAALHQTNARLLVYANLPPAGDATKYLRTLQVVRGERNASGVISSWVAVGDPVTLPAPICIVPTTPVPANHLNTGVTWNNNAATGPVSTLTAAAGFGYLGQTPAAGRAAAQQYFGTNGTGRVLYLEFDATGSVVSNTSTNPTKIALATAVLNPNALPLFNNASSVRGLFVRKSGAVSLVNDATSF
jgi:type II secretory pathway pseudopilin PulG